MPGDFQRYLRQLYVLMTERQDVQVNPFGTLPERVATVNQQLAAGPFGDVMGVVNVYANIARVDNIMQYGGHNVDDCPCSACTTTRILAKANDPAIKMLRSFLNPQQREMYDRSERFCVDTREGNRYQLGPGRMVYYLAGSKKNYPWSICMHVGGYMCPDADVLLSFKLALEADEYRCFLARKSWGPTVLRGVDATVDKANQNPFDNPSPFGVI